MFNYALGVHSLAAEPFTPFVVSKRLHCCAGGVLPTFCDTA
jgi:hypothetical protein